MNMDIAHNPSHHIGEMSNDMPELQNNTINQLDLTFNSSPLLEDDFPCNNIIPHADDINTAMDDDSQDSSLLGSFDKLITSDISELDTTNNDDAVGDVDIDSAINEEDPANMEKPTEILDDIITTAIIKTEAVEEEDAKHEASPMDEVALKNEIEMEVKIDTTNVKTEPKIGIEDGEENELDLSNSLVDHNYSSAVEKPTSEVLRTFLSNHLKEKSKLANEAAQVKMTEFVDDIVSSINSFNLSEDIAKVQNELAEAESPLEKLDFELFVQKIIDSVAPKESHEIRYINPNEREIKQEAESEKETEPEMKKELEDELDAEPQPMQADADDESAAKEKVATSEKDVEILSPGEVQTTEQHDNNNIVLEKLMIFGQMLQEKCKSLICSSVAENVQVTNFVKLQLDEFNDLINKNTPIVVEDKKKGCEISVQTEPSKKALRRMKKEEDRKNKLKLTNGSSSSSDDSSDDTGSNSSSSSSSNTASRCSRSSCDQLNLEKKDTKKSVKKEKNTLKQMTSSSRTPKMEVDHVDEVTKGNEMDETKNQNSNEDDCDENDDDEDQEIERLINFDGLLKRSKYVAGSNLPVKNAENTKQKVKLSAKDLFPDESPTDEDDSNEDETTKMLEDGQLVDGKINDLACNGEENARPTDDETDKETITEKEFLKRYNDTLKQDFLNDSSSMSEDASDSDLIKDLLPEEEDNADNVVDKFLESYDADQDDVAEDLSDEEDEEEEDKDESKVGNATNKDKDKDVANKAQEDSDEYDEIVAKKRNSDLKSSLSEFIQLPKSPVQVETEKSEPECTEVKSPAEKSDDTKKDDSTIESNLSSSDCELLNDSSLLAKTKKPKKSLEKMLTEAEKRKKASKLESSDLISLSSASTSDGGSEGEDGEGSGPGLQSRVLKPMLRQDQLASETRRAQKLEADRIRRLDKKISSLAKILKERDAKNEKPVEREHELILDYNSETKTFIKVHPHIVKQLKSHQIDGIKFMYDSCYGGVDALKKSTGSGCILAHCMGLGKTLQLIALLHTVISYKELKTNKILVLCPKSTVMNWADEIIRWLGPVNAKNLKVFTFSDTSDINEKLRVLRDWSLSTAKRAGCLLIGYEAFRSLVFYHSYKNRGNYGTSYMEEIREKVENCLLKPGADLVVCDEGHIIKNSKSAISLAVSKIITTKRIILTGTPIQNNLKEYYSMVNFIKPLFLGTEKEFANLYANPIKNGQHKDSSKRDIQVMKQRSFVLHRKLSKFVQRKEAELLKTFLPKKFEYVLFIPMSDVQNNLYEHILEAIGRREENRGRSLITDYTCLRKIWTHPKVLEDAWTNAINQKNKKDAKKIPSTVHSDDDQPDDIYDSHTGVMSVTNDWWRQLITEQDLETILPSNKLRTMFEILRMCEEKDEKCLIFSAFVAVLNVVEFFFKKINSGDPVTLKELNIAPTSKLRNKWVLGQDYYRLDGKTAKNLRHEMVKRFNASSNRQARVFLISAKAGGQGINLIGANRVIILDTSWNPSNDQQNIFRIFRLGQKKNCYIYRVLAMGTMEEKVYSRSVTKQAMSFRVVDEQQIDRHYSMAELAELYTLTKPNPADRPMPIFPQDSILASLLLNFPDMVYKYHEHDSLLENKVEQELSEQEKAEAWAAYERDMQMTSEVQEHPNMEGMRNNFNMPHMRNYFGIDMQTMLNYGNLTNPGVPPNFMQSLMSQFNYGGSNQQYLEMLSLYSKYAQSPLAYPELGGAMAGGVYPSTSSGAHFGSGANKSPGYPPGAAGLPSNNPLSALGDLSGLYGMAAGKNYPALGGLGSKANPSASSMFMPHAANGVPPSSTPNIYGDNSNLLLPPPIYSNSGLANSSGSNNSFKPSGPFSNMYNYNSDFTSPHRTPSSAMNYASSAANMHLTPMLNSATNPPLSGSPSPFATASSKTVGNNMPPAPRTIDLTKTTMDYNKNTQPPPLVDLTRKPFKDGSGNINNKNIKSPFSSTSVTTPNITTSIDLTTIPSLSLPTMAAAAAGSITTKRPSGSKDSNRSHVISELQKTVTTKPMSPISSSPMVRNTSAGVSALTTPTNSGINNLGIKRPNLESPLKKITNNEMIIIPTTSPPGPTSISKQFTEISPSISLTAVRNNNNNNTNSNTTNTPLSTPPSSKSMKSMSTPALLPINGNNNLTNNKSTKSPINNPVSPLKLFRPAKPSPLSSPVQSKSTPSMATITASSIKNNSKTPSSATLSSSQVNTITDSNNGSSLNNKSPTITVAKFANMPTRRTNAPTNNNNTNNSNIKNITNNNTPVTQKTATSTTTNMATKKTYIAPPKPPVNNNNNNKNANTAYPPLVNISATNKSNSSAKSSTVGRSGTTISPPLSNAQMQKIRDIGASTQRAGMTTSTRSGMVRSNTSGISIRPVEQNEKSSTKSANVIIETNINDKLVAIGVPTKSGNGTTVTKISLPLKRKRPNIDGVGTTDNSKRQRE